MSKTHAIQRSRTLSKSGAKFMTQFCHRSHNSFAQSLHKPADVEQGCCLSVVHYLHTSQYVWQVLFRHWSRWYLHRCVGEMSRWLDYGAQVAVWGPSQLPWRPQGRDPPDPGTGEVGVNPEMHCLCLEAEPPKLDNLAGVTLGMWLINRVKYSNDIPKIMKIASASVSISNNTLHH